MNANELADELERPNNWQQENNFNNQAATMLRQQQAEIEALKLCCPKCGNVTGKLEVLNVPAKTCQHGVDDGACKECYAEAQEK